MYVDYLQIAVSTAAIGVVIRSVIMARRRHPGGWSAFWFTALGVNVCAYVIANYLSMHPPLGTLAEQLLWIKIDTAVGGGLLPVLVVLLAACYPGAAPASQRRLFPVLALAGGFLTVSSFFVFMSVQMIQGIPYPTPVTWLLLAWTAVFTSLFVMAIVIAVRGYMRAPLLERSPRLYFVVSLITSFLLMEISSLIANVFLKSSATIFMGPLAWLVLFVMTPMGNREER